MRKVILIAAFAAASLIAQAQTAQSTFFLSHESHSYRLNAAVTDTASFVGMGGMDYATRGNVGTSAFVYPNPNAKGIVTGLNSSITSEEFLSNLKEDNFRSTNMLFNLFSYGKAGKNGVYQTFEANLRANMGVSVPKEVFEILKVGNSQTDYDISGFNLNAHAYVEFAYGYKRQINDWLSVGGRAKLLAGMVNGDYTINRLDVHMGEDSYTMNVEANLKASTPVGVGAAFDFGVLMTPVKGLEISAAVNNIGAIRWKYNKTGVSNGEVTFNGFDKYNAVTSDTEELNSTVTGLIKDMKSAFKIESSTPDAKFSAVPLSANAGVKYHLPFYENAYVGAIGYFDHGFFDNYVEGRVGAGIDLWNWLNLAANAGAGTYNAVWGFSTGIRYQHFRLNCSMENPFSKFIPTHRSYMPAIPIPLEPYATSISLSLTYVL